jgi:hypothetical protein
MVGDDANNTPPAHALARRGIIQNVHGYMLVVTTTILNRSAPSSMQLKMANWM